jgi:hypothetical protein
MPSDFPLDSPQYALATELTHLLRRDYLRGEQSVLIEPADGRFLIWLMSASTDTLGLLLATVSREGELGDPDSFSRRIVPGDTAARPGQWQYVLTPSRFPLDRSIMFSLRIYAPLGDLPELVSRML